MQPALEVQTRSAHDCTHRRLARLAGTGGNGDRKAMRRSSEAIGARALWAVSESRVHQELSSVTRGGQLFRRFLVTSLSYSTPIDRFKKRARLFATVSSHRDFMPGKPLPGRNPSYGRDGTCCALSRVSPPRKNSLPRGATLRLGRDASTRTRPASHISPQARFSSVPGAHATRVRLPRLVTLKLSRRACARDVAPILITPACVALQSSSTARRFTRVR